MKIKSLGAIVWALALTGCDDSGLPNGGGGVDSSVPPPPADRADNPNGAQGIACGEVKVAGLSRRQHHAYFTFTGQPGQQVDVRATPMQSRRSAVLALFDPSDLLLGEPEACADDPDAACLSVALTTAGVHSIGATLERVPVGDVQVSLKCTHPPPPGAPPSTENQLEFEELPCDEFHQVARTELLPLTENAQRYFFDALPAQAAAELCAISIGVPPAGQVPGFVPEAEWRGRPVDRVCLLSPGGPRCMEAHGPAMHAGCTGNGDFRGICGVLSVAHSLYFKLGLVDDDTAVRDVGGRKVWNRDFLEALRRSTRHQVPEDGDDPSGGTTAEGEMQGHLDFGARACGDVLQPAASTAAGMRAWCLGLMEANAHRDCSLRLHERVVHWLLDEIKVGHTLHIQSATWDPVTQQCTVTTADTGVQGCSHGDDIPINPGTQTWHLKATNLTPLVSVVYDPSQADYGFWGTRGYNQAAYFCCR